ncbi:MAG: hypothetical protein ACO3VO_09620, partial [Ilumatobacteraceae bacterium]
MLLSTKFTPSMLMALLIVSPAVLLWMMLGPVAPLLANTSVPPVMVLPAVPVLVCVSWLSVKLPRLFVLAVPPPLKLNSNCVLVADTG